MSQWASRCGFLGRQYDRGQISTIEFALALSRIILALDVQVGAVVDSLSLPPAGGQYDDEIKKRARTIEHSLRLHRALTVLVGKHYVHLMAAVKAARLRLSPSSFARAVCLAKAANAARHARFRGQASQLMNQAAQIVSQLVAFILVVVGSLVTFRVFALCGNVMFTFMVNLVMDIVKIIGGMVSASGTVLYQSCDWVGPKFFVGVFMGVLFLSFGCSRTMKMQPKLGSWLTISISWKRP